MSTVTKRKTSLTLDVEALNNARELNISISAVAEAALEEAIDKVRRQNWLNDNADAFAAQADWHERNGHPLTDIIVAPGGLS